MRAYFNKIVHFIHHVLTSHCHIVFAFTVIFHVILSLRIWLECDKIKYFWLSSVIDCWYTYKQSIQKYMLTSEMTIAQPSNAHNNYALRSTQLLMCFGVHGFVTAFLILFTSFSFPRFCALYSGFSSHRKYHQCQNFLILYLTYWACQ